MPIQKLAAEHLHHNRRRQAPTSHTQPHLPLVVTLNCLEDPGFEQDTLSGLATVEHIDLSQITTGRIESASVIILHSLAFLPRAAQRRIQQWQLVLCLGSADRAVDSTLAADLGLKLVHVDANRSEEIADTIMALFLGLLRRTHALSGQVSAVAASSSGWLGSIQPLCKGMRRCRGLVLGIIGRSASAKCLAIRSLAFRMSVFYFDVHIENEGRHRIVFPSAARKMDTLNDLLAASDLISLHCALSNETVHIIRAECLQHIKPGAFIVNTGSSQLIDDCALKQLLIDGTVAGCALDGAEGPQWMEAWIREMPNVLILPRSADYSEEVWMEIREKAVTVLHTFLLDGIVPDNAISDEDEEKIEVGYDGDEQSMKEEAKDSSLQICVVEQMTDGSQLDPGYSMEESGLQMTETRIYSQGSGIIQNVSSRTEGRRSRSGKKAKKRPAHHRSHLKLEGFSEVEGDSNSTSQQDDDTAMSVRDQVLSSSSRFASPENTRNKQMCLEESSVKLTPDNALLNMDIKLMDILREGYIIALDARNGSGLYISRQRLPSGGGWFLDKMSNVTKRDPAAQFLVTFNSKGTMGLRSLSSGGKLLQVNRKMEFLFTRHDFDVYDSWMLEGSSLEDCRLVNCKKPKAVLDVRFDVLATIGNEDGITRWID